MKLLDLSPRMMESQVWMKGLQDPHFSLTFYYTELPFSIVKPKLVVSYQCLTLYLFFFNKMCQLSPSVWEMLSYMAQTRAQASENSIW